MSIIVELEEKEYLLKKLDAAKEILPILLSQHPPEFITDVRKRASVIYNCVSVAEDLLSEVGLKLKGAPIKREAAEDLTAIRKLGDLLKSDK